MMDQFPIPNRQRRRSNLGRRNKAGEVAPWVPVPPVFPVPVARGLGRSRSGSKSAKKPKAISAGSQSSSSAISLFAKKKLFLLSPPNFLSANKSQGDSGGLGASSSVDSSLKLPSYNNIALDETGVNILSVTPSPNRLNSTLTFHSSVSKNATFKNSQPPMSPGPSKYDQFMFAEYSKTKPPIDPDDLVNIAKPLSEAKNINPDESSFHHQHINVAQHQKVDVELKSPKKEADEKVNIMKILSLHNDSLPSGKKQSSIVNHRKSKSPDICLKGCEETKSPVPLNVSVDLDTTDSFIFAEQTIICEDQTLHSPSQILHSPTFIKPTASKSLTTKRHLDPVFEEEQHIDEDLIQALSKVEKLEKFHKQIMEELGDVKKQLKNCIEKQQKRSLKETLENKENIPATSSKNIKSWIKDMKSDNPSLLKTPKCVARFPQAEEHPLLTPHSLSTVLTDQIDDLFD